ncbi:pilus assembly PilX family protein [Janthinobacterium sp. RB2R34]|uniref:pilus assembly PilX family protein n=1 Tax=Janthinobacterium sp. RB2R34 TaxID=3424193 RepID=UPI003F2938E5
MDRPEAARARERGATLVFALCLLVAILLLGASAAQMALHGEKSARGERDRHIAFQAAEEALMDAQHDIEGLPGQAGRSTLFAADSAAGFASACKGEPGLCLPAASGTPPVWLSTDLGVMDSGTVAYGQFTGAAMQTGQGFLPFKKPRYMIELLPFHPPGEEAGASAGAAVGLPSGAGYLYRVTAIGFGAQEDTQVVLQTFYRKQAPGEAP